MNRDNGKWLVGTALVLGSAPAHAYLDPGTGSAIIQGAIAMIAAAGVALRLYWARVVAFFAPTKVRPMPSDDAAESETPSRDTGEGP